MAHSRPSTSGGLPARGLSRANIDKRMSKDDMFFNSTRKKHTLDKRISRDDSYIRSRMGAMSQYRVPDRGSAPPTPEHSPQYPVTHEMSIPIRMQTPESMKSDHIPIGMALGSPSLPQKDTSKGQAQAPSASPQAAISSQPSATATAPTGSLQRKKTNRRKLFGLFASGKKKEDAPVSGEVEAGTSTTTLGRLRGASTSTVNVPATKKTPTRSHTQTERKAPKHKPIMIRSQTMPYEAEEPATQPASAGLPNLKSKGSEPYLRQGNAYQRRPANSGVPPVPSFLDVNIPDTTLERYSVMFSDVLNQGPKQETAVSLLARRQATLERLKTINNNIEVEMEKEKSRQRRATSPQPAPSPELALFPMPPAGRITPGMETPKLQSQSRLTRSNTSPGRLPTPTQATFDIQKSPSIKTAKGSHPRNLVVPNLFESSLPPTTYKPGRKEPEPIYPTDTSFHFGPVGPDPILESPTDMDAPDDSTMSQPFKPTIYEPHWQAISPPPAPASSSSSTAPSSALSPSALSPTATATASSPTTTVRTHTTKPSNEIDDADAAFQNAVEVSIARQISISRQQRELLRPLQSRKAGGGAGGAGGAGPKGVKVPSPTRRLTNDETIKETKISTPKLVHPRESPVNPAHLAQNRKSSWAVVEGE